MTTSPARLWIPGDWPGTNAVLDLARQAGHWSGVARALGRPARTAPISLDGQVRRARELVRYTARAARLVAPPGLLDVTIYLAGSGRLDPDAWSAAGKWILDGLVDARVIPSDRKAIWATRGRCLQAGEQRALFAAWGWRYNGPAAGAAVELAPADLEWAAAAPEMGACHGLD